MTVVSNEFLARWRQEAQTLIEGSPFRRMQKPVTRVYIREGYIQRANAAWDGPAVNAVVVGGNDELPWQGTYVPTSDWVELPNVVACDLTHGLDNRGIGNTTVVIENISYEQRTGFSGLYHAIERGWLAPWRGMETAFTPPATHPENEWSRVLDQKVQIKIWQGYGEDTIVPTFLGFIDDLDMVSMPDQITITARDAGQIMADQRFFGWAKEVSHPDPVTFADRLNAEDEQRTDGWILVDDVSDVVKLILRWCGFKEWYVETANMRLRDKWTVNRESFLMDMIDNIVERTGYTFFIDDPGTADESMGVPTFRMNRALYELPAEDIPQITEANLLKRAQVKFTSEPLVHIIRVRGTTATKDEGGVVLSRDLRRLLAVYRPPWVTETTPSGKRTARIYSRTILDRYYIKKQNALEYAARLVALYQALGSASALVEIPANPGIALDQHVLLVDTGTGLNTRMWTSARSSSFAGGKEPRWTMTLSGSLLDTPNVEAMRVEIDTFTGELG